MRTAYCRRLPHIQPADKPFFVTWTLAGMRPVCRRSLGFSKDGAIFVQQDRDLDNSEAGPKWLGQPEVGAIVKNCLIQGRDRCDYELGAWVIMSNHVHVLILPHRPLWATMRDIKSGSGRLANRVLRRIGQPFWDIEYYDHVVRDASEEARISMYIERNPVRAGLCTDPESWELGSAHKNSNLPAMGR